MSAEQNASGEGAGQFPKFLWMEAVIAAPIPEAQRLVILLIGLSANRRGFNAWRSNTSLMRTAGVSLSTVKRARAAAVELGLLEVTKPAPRGAGNTRTTEYRLVHPRNGVTSDTISGEIVSPATRNGVTRDPEMVSPANPPLVSPWDSLGGAAPVDQEPAGGQPTQPRNTHPEADDDPEPPLRCRTHRYTPVDQIEPCGACKTVREANERRHRAWQERRRTRATSARAAADSCAWCDEHAFRLGPDLLPCDVAVRCDHQTPPDEFWAARAS